MEPHSDHLCLCPLEGIINIIARKWAVLVISIIGHREKIRFNEIMERLDGISPRTLSDILKDLRQANLIHRESFSEIPPRVEYSLTEDGKKLCEAVQPLIRWALERDATHSERCRGNCHDEPVSRKRKLPE
ncbi:DNA-binding HxlR family transcriptional regulator [Methanolinea mesophila]|uniref:winged helix-turn-helix transcriptional regulator n=1 Tax=Methanolinea mesophila TaxID=547055 RepID=UPI001AE2FAB8|nr:helix-turn-helix domain-containing protein [Methanolinea mesophila]MBP1928916.1 DNA-binding HxlR family transcriptional regulator [Methanolinea mesophila]